MASSLDRWLATLSRGTIAIIAIGGGILFIILSNPPRTVCDSQIEFLKEQQKGFLFSDPEDPAAKRVPSFAKMHEYCERAGGPGGCYELFQKMRTLSQDLLAVPEECAVKASKLSEVEEALKKTVHLMVTAAWGTKPPDSYMDKFGWLDVADVNLFCGLKTQVIRFYGEGTWDNYRERLFHELPGAKDLPRKTAWEKLLLSEDCRRYQ